MHVTELHEGVCSLCWYMERHSNHFILVIVPYQRQQKLSWDWSVWRFQSGFTVNIWKVIGLNSTDVSHSRLAAEDGKVWMKILLVNPRLPYDFLCILAFIGLEEDIWMVQNYREEATSVHFSFAVSKLLKSTSHSTDGSTPVTGEGCCYHSCYSPGPSEGNICLKSSLAQIPTSRVLDHVPMRISSLEEPLKKGRVCSSQWGKGKSKYCVSSSHVSNERCVAYCISTDMKISLSKSFTAR